jgi:antitoxin component of RelBE/YafQ-DinJ toxin-antitoxin module
MRKNIQMSDEIANWYDTRAKEMGISTSSFMVMALKQYIDQQTALSFSTGLPALMNQMKEMQNQEKVNNAEALRNAIAQQVQEKTNDTNELKKALINQFSNAGKL